ncbi:hypothetical protein CSQ79_24600 [Gloeocapsopsis sp. IPPAS B-1203]|nr:hypothetical protein CSQ79_24600 [Gloeocapsopsis sp. IPPAS B-1203]
MRSKQEKHTNYLLVLAVADAYEIAIDACKNDRENLEKLLRLRIKADSAIEARLEYLKKKCAYCKNDTFL